MHCVVAPVVHRYERAPGAAHRVVDSPWQIEVSPLMVHGGEGFTVRIVMMVLSQFADKWKTE
jgi:hypothetical protein